MNAILLRLPVLFAIVAAVVQLATLGGRHADLPAGLEPGWPDPRSLVEPLYPIFLDGVCVIAPPAARMYLLVLLQQAAVVAVVSMVAGMGALVARPWVGWGAAWLAALYLPFGLTAHTVQPVTLQVFWTTSAMWFLVKGDITGRRSQLIAAGALAGLALLNHLSGIALPPVVLGAVWIARGDRRLEITWCFLAGLVLGIAPLAFRTQVEEASPVTGLGVRLYSRIAATDRQLEETPRSRLLREVGAGHELFGETSAKDLFDLLSGEGGLTRDQADALLRKVAAHQLRSDPVLTARLTPGAMARIAGPRDAFAELGPASRPADDDDPKVLERSPLPSYAPPLNMGSWPLPVLADWSRATRVWRGAWSLVAMVLALLLALFLRSRALLLFSGLALGPVVVTAVTQWPWTAAFELAMVPFLLSVLVAPAECIARISARKRAQTDEIPSGTDGVEPAEEPAPET